MSDHVKDTTIESAILDIFEKGSDKDSLLTLSRLAKLNPAEDFEGADLREIDLGGEDLSLFNFRYADLRKSNLRGATLNRHAIFGARLEGAVLDDIVWLGEPTRPLFGGNKGWFAVDDKRKRGLVERHLPGQTASGLALGTSEFYERELPFYERATLIAAFSRDWDNPWLVNYFILLGDEFTRLDGTSPPIHAVNSEAPITLRTDNVIDYLKFFCFFVRGEDGPFLIVEDISSPHMPKNFDDKTRASVERELHPVILLSEKDKELLSAIDKEKWFCEGTIFYSGAIFKSSFVVEKNGMIEMTDDNLLISDLPVRVNAPV